MKKLGLVLTAIGTVGVSIAGAIIATKIARREVEKSNEHIEDLTKTIDELKEVVQKQGTVIGKMTDTCENIIERVSDYEYVVEQGIAIDKKIITVLSKNGLIGVVDINEIDEEEAKENVLNVEDSAERVSNETDKVMDNLNAELDECDQESEEFEQEVADELKEEIKESKVMEKEIKKAEAELAMTSDDELTEEDGFIKRIISKVRK